MVFELSRLSINIFRFFTSMKILSFVSTIGLPTVINRGSYVPDFSFSAKAARLLVERLLRLFRTHAVHFLLLHMNVLERGSN